ncbi:MAG: hypothetical protein ABMA15_24760, partial [Vicinamibacterales bacterium]
MHMLNGTMRVAGVALLCGLAVGCQKASPTRPSGVDTASVSAASVTDARTGVTIIAARPASPANNAAIPWAQQPITVAVTNGVTSNSSPLTYTFDVSTDPSFAKVDYSKGGIAAGAGTTSIALDKLAGAKTYYWRALVNPANGTGPYSTIRSFVVGPEVVLGTPNLASPINNAQAFTPVGLTITNIARTGPAGPIVYTVDVAQDSGFGSIVYNVDVAEGGNGQTVVSVPINSLQGGVTYFWRAKAADNTNKITTPYSAPAAFVAQSFNLATAKMWDSPPDFAVWPETARITRIDFTGNAMLVDFDKRDGPGRWPDQIPPGFDGPLEYTLGMCRLILGGWHCAGVVQFWYDRPLDSTAEPSRFWREWWYDAARWGPLASVRPVEGELVGIFVGAGDLRGRTWTRATCPGV